MACQNMKYIYTASIFYCTGLTFNMYVGVTIQNNLLFGDYLPPAIKRKSQIIQLHMHVHVASSPALQTHDENSLLLFLELDRRSLEMRLTQTLLCLLS